MIWHGEQWVVIFGAARRIGSAVARGFACKGASLFLIDIDPALPELVAELRAEGIPAEGHHIDLRDIAAIEQTLPRLIGSRPLVGAVYVTGVRSKQSFAEVTSDDWDRVMDVTLKSAFFCARTMAPRLSQPAPFFITLSSVAAEYVGGECAAYHCAKAGLEQLTRYLAVHLGPRGIRVNAVRLGMIVKTEHHTRYTAPANTGFRVRSEAAHPLRTVGAEDDAVAAVLFLASPAAKFITGDIVTVDGGLTVQDHFSLAQKIGAQT